MEVAMSLLLAVAAYIATGCVVGYLAGLFGVGGGIVIVPVLAFLFHAMGFPQESIMQLAIGTSMATVTVTAVLSTYSHHQNGNVDWRMVKSISPIVVIGSIVGAVLETYVSHRALMAGVVLFELGVAGLFLFEIFLAKAIIDPQPDRLPKSKVVILGGSWIISVVSSVVGIAGGTLFVPFLNGCALTMRRAMGTATALGAPIGLAAAGTYLVSGLLSHNVLPVHCLGYIYVPAFIGCIAGGVWTTRHGINLAKRMDVRVLKLAFSVVLLLAAGKMVAGML
jgi:uncharacterized protein